MRLDRRGLEGLERSRRIALINSIVGLRTAALVGTRDAKARCNLAIMNSLMHVGASPPLLGLLFRPDTVERHTLQNIRARGVYTVNHVHSDMIDAAHQTSARYQQDINEFDAVGLTPLWQEGIEAPFVAEARVRIALRRCEELTLASNGTHLVVGEVLFVQCPDAAFGDDGTVDAALSGSVAVAGLEHYYAGQPLARMAHARANSAPRRRVWSSPESL